MMDANKSLENRTDEMSTLIQECRLVNSHLLADLYSETEMYARGKGNIDYILMTPRIQQSVTYTQITWCNKWIISSCRALVVDIDYKNFETRDLMFWQRPERTFASSMARTRRQFIKECYQKGRKLNWNKRLEKMKKAQSMEEVEASLNSLDKEVTQVFSSVAKQLKRKPRPPRSTKLNDANACTRCGGQKTRESRQGDALSTD